MLFQFSGVNSNLKSSTKLEVKTSNFSIKSGILSIFLFCHYNMKRFINTYKKQAKAMASKVICTLSRFFIHVHIIAHTITATPTTPTIVVGI
jgi:hypothetical protein